MVFEVRSLDLIAASTSCSRLNGLGVGLTVVTGVGISIGLIDEEIVDAVDIEADSELDGMTGNSETDGNDVVEFASGIFEGGIVRACGIPVAEGVDVGAFDGVVVGVIKGDETIWFSIAGQGLKIGAKTPERLAPAVAAA